MTVDLVEYTPAPVRLIDLCASVCYDSEPTLDGKIAKQCSDSGHWSVWEHSSFTFRIRGCSRAATHQLVRHRTGKYSQRSQRYCVEDGKQYVIPPSIEKKEDALALYKHTIDQIWDAYDNLIANGIEIPPEDARYLLPNACSTEIYVTFDARNLIHFMNERLCTCAQWEIRQIALKMRECLLKAGDCDLIWAKCVPKCESGKVPYCSEPPRRSCGRQPLAKEINAKFEGWESNPTIPEKPNTPKKD